MSLRNLKLTILFPKITLPKLLIHLFPCQKCYILDSFSLSLSYITRKHIFFNLSSLSPQALHCFSYSVFFSSFQMIPSLELNHLFPDYFNLLTAYTHSNLQSLSSNVEQQFKAKTLESKRTGPAICQLCDLGKITNLCLIIYKKDKSISQILFC